VSSKNGSAIKRPIAVEYFHYEGTQDNGKLGNWIGSFEVEPHTVLIGSHDGSGTLRVGTLEGHSYDLPNDYYVIRGVKGEFYPCEGKIFRETYQILD
jgi:hypothetical protein